MKSYLKKPWYCLKLVISQFTYYSGLYYLRVPGQGHNGGGCAGFPGVTQKGSRGTGPAVSGR